MRTGSNLFEYTINQASHVRCLGELFNPHFIGEPEKDAEFNTTLEERTKKPIEFWNTLLERERNNGNILGFRFFDDHDSRILRHLMKDKTCAKIILRRNPLYAFVSKEISLKTDQWRVFSAFSRIDTQIEFSHIDYEQYLEENNDYYSKLEWMVRRAGQTAFYINYTELLDLSIMNGLLDYLGVKDRIRRLTYKTIRQNPKRLEKKVTNPDALHPYLRDNIEEPPKLHSEMSNQWDFKKIHISERLNRIWITLTDFGHKPRRTFYPIKALKEVADFQEKNHNARLEVFIEHPLHLAYRQFDRMILHSKGKTAKIVRDELLMRHIALIEEDDTNDLTREKITALGFTKDDVKKMFHAFVEFIKDNLNYDTYTDRKDEWQFYLERLAPFSSLMPMIDIIHQSEEESIYQGLFKIEELYSSEIDTMMNALYKNDMVRLGIKPWGETFPHLVS